MSSLMDVFISFSDESHWAPVANVLLLTGMNLFVVGQTIFELEPLSAYLVWALVWVRVAQKFQVVDSSGSLFLDILRLNILIWWNFLFCHNIILVVRV